MQDACLGRKWSILAPLLRQDNLARVRTLKGQHLDTYRYLVRKHALQVTKPPHDLYIEFEVDKRDPKRVEDARLGAVIGAKAGFPIEVDEPLRAFAKAAHYPKASAIPRVLEQKEVREAAKELPVLHKIDVFYGLIRDRRREGGLASGFGVDAYLRRTAADNKRYASLFYSVERGFDPLKDWAENVVGPYRGQATEGEVRFWGGSGVPPDPFERTDKE